MIHPLEKSYVQPGRAEVHFDQALTDISHAYMQDPNAFVADQVFPILPVSKPTNKYFIYDKGDFNRDEMKKRAPSTESAGSSWRLSTDNYSADVWALHRDVDDQIRATADTPLSPDSEASRFLAQKALLRKEVLWASEYFAAGLWDSDLTGNATPTGDQFLFWDDAASDPIVQIRRGVRRVHENTGLKPNKLVLGKEVYDTLLDHPDIVDRLNRGQTPGGPAIVLRRNMAELFELDEILVMEAVQNTAAENQTPAMSYIGGKSALLLHVPATPGLYTPSAGYTFSWTGLLGGGALSARIGRMRMPAIKSDRFEIEMAFDQKLAAADLGQFYDAAIQ